jgi:hypothetical protein
MQKHLAELKRAINRAPKNDRGRRTYGKPLRKRITEATLAELDKGRPLTRVAAELGIRDQVLGGWVRKHRGPGAVRTVEVVDDPTPIGIGGLRMVLPGGAVVEGLSLSDVSNLLRQAAS